MTVKQAINATGGWYLIRKLSKILDFFGNVVERTYDRDMLKCAVLDYFELGKFAQKVSTLLCLEHAMICGCFCL